MDYVTAWHCDYANNGVVDTTSDCYATATSTNTIATTTTATTTLTSCGNASTTPCYNEITYHDFIFTASVIVFLLAFYPISFIFSPFRTRR